MGAILPMLTPVGSKRPTAMDAADDVTRRLISFVTMSVPPLLPALFRTELPFLSLRHLHKRLTASKTHSKRTIPRQFVVATKGLHSIDRYAHHQGNLFISEAISAQHMDLLFLFFCHSKKHLLQGSLGKR